MATPPVNLDPNGVPQADPQGGWQDQPLENFFDPAAQPQGAPQAPPPAPAPPQSEWFLEAPTGTRYRSAAEAAAGVAEKDRVIAQQRAALAALAGGQPPQAAAPTFVDILNQGVERDPHVVDQYLADFVERQVQSRLNSTLGGLNNMIGYATMNWAAKEASRIDPNIPAFVDSPAFQQVCKTYPIVGDAIQNVQRNPQQLSGQLPQIFHLAYKLAGTLPQAAAPPAAPLPQNTNHPPQTVAAPGRQGVSVLDLPLEDVFK